LKFSIRWYENRKDSDKTMFMDCVAFGQTAEYMAQRLEKGAPAYVEGELINDRWEDDQGRKRDSWCIKVREYVALSTAPREQGQQAQPFKREEKPAQPLWGQSSPSNDSWSKANDRRNDPF
jgi:single-strand DNA-binding protein